jgi:hypothetical protein
MPKADNEDTTVSEPTTEEVVDTSTNEETQDTEDSTDLEDMEISFDDVEDDETEESEDGEDETTDTEPAETEEESTEDVEPEAEEAQEDEEPEDSKKHNAEMAARRIAERQAREKAKADQQQRFLEEAEDAKDLALRQLQVDAYNNRVDKHKNNLENGIEKAIASIDLFRTGTPEVKEALADSLEKFERMYVQYDTNGDPINVTGDVYEYLQTEADSIRRLINTGARGQSKAKEKAKARTETLPTRAPKEPKVDPDLQAFDEEVAKWS